MMKKRFDWSINEQAVFLKKIGELLKRGYPISEAIESVTFQMSSKRKRQLTNVLRLLKDGLPFHQVLQELKFHTDLIGYVFFAEEHGNLAEAIMEGSEMLLKRDKDMQKLLKLLYYPSVLIAMTFMLLIFVERTLLPRFTVLFRSMDLKENLFTKIVFGISSLMPLVIGLLGAMVVLGITYYYLHYRHLSIISKKTKIVSIPFAGSIFRLFYTHYFCIQLSYLLSGGLSVYESLQLFERNKAQELYSQIGKEIKRKMVRGDELEDILNEFEVFERDLPRIIKHGQQNGKLEKEMYFYSQHCINLLEAKMERSLKLIQPVLYSFIGILIVCMYLAILLPMFHLMDGI